MVVDAVELTKRYFNGELPADAYMAELERRAQEGSLHCDSLMLIAQCVAAIESARNAVLSSNLADKRLK